MGEIDDVDVKAEIIQAVIPAALINFHHDLGKEIKKLTGERYEHGRDNYRWGRQNGSVYLLDQKVPVKIQRVRNKLTKKEVPLKLYQRLQEPYRADQGAFKKLLNGISAHRYQESAEIVPEVFGLSASNMSRRLKKATATKLRHLNSRSLKDYDLVAIFIDGKRFAEEGIIVALGITIEGEKVILGIDQMSAENHRALKQFFDKLLARGLRFEQGLLFIVDGSKGIIKAIKDKFQGYAVIQRCQWHKRENVVSYLNRAQQALWRRKLQAAYAEETHKEAETALKKLANDLERINESAANSLREGMSDTLTVHRLGLNRILARSFSTTNCIESILAQVEQYTQRVDRWRGGAHIQRWVASGLLEVESRLRKINGRRHLESLRDKIKEELERQRREKRFPVEQELAEAGA